MISLLTDNLDLEILPFSRIRKAPSSMLLLLLLRRLLHYHFRTLMPSSLRYPIQTQNLMTAPSKISDFVPPVKEKANTGDWHDGDGHKRGRDRTATGAIGIRGPPKRTAGNAGLNEGGENMPRSEKVRRIDSSTGLNRYISRLKTFERPYRQDR